MESIFEAINEWLKELLIGAINGNLSNMFGDVNEKVGTIAAQAGQTPQGWNGGVFSMIQNLSQTVILPIAGIVITSLSVSDVVVLHQNGKDTAHYTDSIGFVDISKDFLLENPLRAAEQSTEQNANMIDGIINNTPAADGLDAATGEQISLAQYAETLKQDEAPKTAEQDTAQLTELQQKAAEIAKGYETLSMQDRIDIIAQSFGCTSGKIETSPCTGKWRGTSDISIKFDNDTSLFIGNHRTPQAKTQKVQNEYVNSALVRYNPEIIMATKEAAIDVLRKWETKDNEIAAQKGLKPYTLLNVELNDGTDEKSGGHMGWYYVTLAVGSEIHAHIETGLNYAIADGKVSETPTRENYFVAGALKESDVDYVFNNTGFSSTSDLYSLPIREDVRERAEKTLAERTETQQKAPETKTIYYTINEGAARRANDANSYYDYKPGSATAEYRSMVDKAVEIAENQKKRVDPMYHEKIDSLVDTYARKLAENMNSSFSIEARVPSILIAGGSNFPVRKKEKQNAARDRNMEEWNDIQGLVLRVMRQPQQPQIKMPENRYTLSDFGEVRVSILRSRCTRSKSCFCMMASWAPSTRIHSEEGLSSRSFSLK